MARAVAVALLGLAVVGGAAGARAAAVVDVLLAQVDGAAVTASDVALARALGLFGFAPGAGPITADDVGRYVDVRLVLGETALLGIEVTPAEVEAAWDAVAARLGGRPALEAWLEGTDIEREWARTAVAADVRWRRFIELRFREFVFVTDQELAAVLGPPPHDPDARERARERLVAAAVRRELTAWLEEARRRAAIATLDATPVPLPFALPTPHAGRPAVAAFPGTQLQ